MSQSSKVIGQLTRADPTDFVDSSLLADWIQEGRRIDESVSIISVIEYPNIVGYDNFFGRVIYPELDDFKVALELQQKLQARGRMQGTSDLIIAAICINRGARLITADRDFEEISKVGDLKVIWK